MHGSYFGRNFGDTLLCRTMCQIVGKIVGQENVFLATEGDPEERAEIGFPVAPKDIRKDIDYLIFAGGGYFGEPPGGWIQTLRWALRNRKRHLSWLKEYSSARIGIFGVGLGPIRHRFFRRKVHRLIENAEVILLRDNESIRYAMAYGFPMRSIKPCTDMAMTLIAERERGRMRQSSGLAMHLNSTSLSLFEILMDGLSAHPCFHMFRHISFISDSPDKNESFEKKIMPKVKVVERLGYSWDAYPYADVNELLELLKGVDFMMTDKLHVGICTIALGGKVLAVPKHHKTRRFYRQIGVPRWVLDRADIAPHEIRDRLDVISRSEPSLSDV